MANNNSEISSEKPNRDEAKKIIIPVLKGEPSKTGAYEPLEKSPTLGNLALTAYNKYCNLTKAIGIKLRLFIGKSAKVANEYITIKAENTLVGMKNIIDDVIDNVEANKNKNKKSQGKGKD